MMRIGLTLYPELLTYADKTEPWICVQLELDADRCPWWDGKEDENKTAELLLLKRENWNGRSNAQFYTAFHPHTMGLFSADLEAQNGRN